MCSTGCDRPWSAAGGKHPGGPIQDSNPLGQSRHHHHHHLQQLLFSVRRCPCSRSPVNIRELRNQVIVYPRQQRENFLVHHSSLGSLGEMRRPSGLSIGGTWGQWRSRGGRKQELEDPEIVFPIVVTFVCFEEKSESGGNLVSTFTFLFFLLTFVKSKCSSHL